MMMPPKRARRGSSRGRRARTSSAEEGEVETTRCLVRVPRPGATYKILAPMAASDRRGLGRRARGFCDKELRDINGEFKRNFYVRKLRTMMKTRPS